MQTTIATAHASLTTIEMVISVLLLIWMANLKTRFSEGGHIAIPPNRQSRKCLVLHIRPASNLDFCTLGREVYTDWRPGS
jgi:hypothetical protein